MARYHWFHNLLLTQNCVASASRGFGSPSAGFGAGLQNVPSPIATTSTQRQSLPLDSITAGNIREPLPRIQLPGITETFKKLAPDQANQPPVSLLGRPVSIAKNTSVARPSERGLLNGSSQENGPYKKDPVALLSIYTRRADQIGPSHHIPGIGHLGNLLTPPGWKLGDEPIDEAEAQRIFEASRLKAKESLDEGMSEIEQMSIADQEKNRVEKEAQYHTQRNIDEYLLMERVKLHKFWEERKQKLFHQLHSEPQQHPRLSKPNQKNCPHPLQPPAETSMTAYQRHQQSLVPASPHLYAPSPPLSGGTLNARVNFMQQGMIARTRDRESIGADEELSCQAFIYLNRLQ